MRPDPKFYVKRHDTGPWHVGPIKLLLKGGCYGHYHSKIVANNEARKLNREPLMWGSDNVVRHTDQLAPSCDKPHVAPR